MRFGRRVHMKWLLNHNDAAILINQYAPKEESYNHPIVDAEHFDKSVFFDSMKNGSHAEKLKK